MKHSSDGKYYDNPRVHRGTTPPWKDRIVYWEAAAEDKLDVGEHSGFVALCTKCDNMPISDVAWVCTDHMCRRARRFPYGLCQTCYDKLGSNEHGHFLNKKKYNENDYDDIAWREMWREVTSNGELVSYPRA